MSGFDRETRSYVLTASKVAFWHRSRGARGGECSRRCRTAAGMVAEHVIDCAGFTVLSIAGTGTAWRVFGPGIEDGWTDQLYEAISGNPSRGDRSPARRWRF